MQPIKSLACALSLGLVAALAVAMVGTAPPAADEFFKTLDSKSTGIVDSEILGELNAHLYERIAVKDGRVELGIDNQKVAFAIHGVVMSWKGLIGGVLSFKSKDKRVRDIKEKHRDECTKAMPTLGPILAQLPGVAVTDASKLSASGKKLLAIAKICSVVLDRAGDQIYAKEGARARL